MLLADFIGRNAFLSHLQLSSKKQALSELSHHGGKISGLAEREIYDALLQRERLGSTGVGNAIAIPHGKLANAKGIFGVFAQLERPIDFESLDGLPVDLIFMIIAPESSGADHLKALAKVARALRDPVLTSRLRAARDEAVLADLFLTYQLSSHAA